MNRKGFGMKQSMPNGGIPAFGLSENEYSQLSRQTIQISDQATPENKSLVSHTNMFVNLSMLASVYHTVVNSCMYSFGYFPGVRF
jgi:hypothetical protein